MRSIDPFYLVFGLIEARFLGGALEHTGDPFVGIDPIRIDRCEWVVFLMAIDYSRNSANSDWISTLPSLVGRMAFGLLPSSLSSSAIDIRGF